MIAAIHQPQYLPWLGYFDKMYRADIFILLDTVQFVKNEYQNRNRIRTADGWHWLTVPVLHDSGQLIKDVRINNTVNWRREHLNALTLNYGQAPFFDHYIERITPLYDREWDRLSDLSCYCVALWAELLGIRTPLVRASEFSVSDDPTQRLIDLCAAVGADTYLAGASAKDYMDMERCAQHNLQILPQHFIHPQYTQFWMTRKRQQFHSQMCVLDLLFNCGPQSLAILTKTGT